MLKTDCVTVEPVARLAACLGVPVGRCLPALWHWLFFLDAVPAHELGRDGHRAKGGPVPHDPGLPSRLWAGGRLRFFGDVGIGTALRRESRIKEITERQGRSGRLRFVTMEHKISSDATLLVLEEQDLVYRAPNRLRPTPAPAPAAPPGACLRTVVPDEVLLFRFSALTFNAHRVHYDLPYAQAVEQYPGLLVHGPLQAILLAGHLSAVCADGVIRQFDYRGQATAFANQPLQLEAWQDTDSRTRWHLQTRDCDGAVCMTAEAHIKPIDVSQAPRDA